MKVVDSLDRLDYEGELEGNVEGYSKIVYSVGLKRKVKLVVLKWNKGNKMGTALLYTTDLELEAMTHTNQCINGHFKLVEIRG